MKINFEFDTDSPEFDSRELETYFQAPELRETISDITDYLKELTESDKPHMVSCYMIQEKVDEIISKHINKERIGLL